MVNVKEEIQKIHNLKNNIYIQYQIIVMILVVLYLSAALSVRITLKDVSHHGNVTFLHCPVEGSLSILM